MWDHRPEFDDQHETWLFDGPSLPIEFSRVSETRERALTLVIDPVAGTPCTVAYARSRRANPQDAICDLRSREGTTLKNIGSYFRDDKAPDSAASAAIAKWAATKDFDVVVWTALPSNFRAEVGENFSVAAAVKHLSTLPPEGKAAAATYVWRAPELVQTPLRSALQTEPWFQAAR